MKYILSIVLAFLFTQLAHAAKTFTPISPQNYQREWNIVSEGEITPMTNLQINQELPHQSLTYSYRLKSNDASAKGEYLTFLSESGRIKNEQVEILAEWSKYITEPNSKNNQKFLYRVGIGVRISFFLTLKKKMLI